MSAPVHDNDGEAIATPEADVVEHGMSGYAIGIGPFGLVLDAEVKAEVLQGLAVHPMPDMPPWMPGLINLRGALVPVFDLERFWGEVQDRKAPWLLVVGRGEDAAAIPIRQLPHSLELLEAAPDVGQMPMPIADFVRTAYRGAGRRWYALDFEALFTSLGTAIDTAEPSPLSAHH